MPHAAVFSALADPTRRAVLEQLAHGEQTVSKLNESFTISQPAISQHLSVLRHAGLVTERRSGRFTYYRAQPDGLIPLMSWVDRYRAFRPERIERLTHVIDGLDR